jgi:magnesium transporter
MKTTSDSLLDAVSQRGAHDAADLLEKASGEDAAHVLQRLNPMVAQQVMAEMEEEPRTAAMTFVPLHKARQWAETASFPRTAWAG